MPGGEVSFLLEHVGVFGGLGGVLDLSDPAARAASEMCSTFFLRMSRAT
ncbi:hypothetical protein [Brachybacterium sp. GPGPB12]